MTERHRSSPHRTRLTARCLPVLFAVGSVALGSVALGPFGGCASDPTKGYALQSTYRTDVRSVNVPIFENRTFERDLQFELADALVKEIEATTPWKVTRGGVADTSLTGAITRVELRQLSKSRRTGLTEEGVVSLTIDFEWRDLRTGQAIVRRQAFTASGLFLPSQGAGEPIEIGRYAAIQALARDIVTELRSPW